MLHQQIEIPELSQRHDCTLTSGATVHIVEFEIDTFETRAYAQAGIPLPNQIARSGTRRRAEFFFGRLAAKSALRAQGALCTQVDINVHRAPVWPSGFVGSISHGKRHAAAIALPRAACRGIGLDIEANLEPNALVDVEQIALNSSEVMVLKSINAPYSNMATLAFSAKESFYKAASESAGGFFGFEAMEIKHIDLKGRSIDFVLLETVSQEFPAGTTGSVHFFEFSPGIYLTYYWW